MKKIAIISTVLMFALISLSLFLTHLNIMSGSKNTIDYYRAYEISKDEYTLHTYIDDLNKVSFYITDDTNALIYKCEKSWRASDLKTIDFDSNTYDVLIVSGDIGTVRYVYCDETWIEK